MSAGTTLITRAMKAIGVYSPAMPIQSESITDAKDILNGMLARWYGDGIDMGASPLKSPGSELSEPVDATEGIIANLALELAPEYPDAKVSQELRRKANRGYKAIERRYYAVDIPKKVARDTYPKGQGNYSNFFLPEIFRQGEEVGSDG